MDPEAIDREWVTASARAAGIELAEQDVTHVVHHFRQIALAARMLDEVELEPRLRAELPWQA